MPHLSDGANQKPPVVPLKPIPVLGKHFSHIVLNHSVYYHYNTHVNSFLEAIPLHAIRMPNIVKALVTASSEPYQYTVIPFDMKNVPATYQQMIGYGAYINDLMIYNDTWEQHSAQL